MIQKKRKQLTIGLIIILIIALLGVGAWGIYTALNEGNNNNESIDNAQDNLSEFDLKRLIVETTLSKEYLEEEYKPTNISINLDGTEEEIKVYSLEYNTREETKEAYEKIKEDEQIKSVTPDKIKKVSSETKKIFYWQITSENSISSWGALSMGLDETEAIIDSKTDNPEIVVAVIDSGLDTDHSTITSAGLSSRILSGYNAIEGNTDVEDNDGHGTNVAGIILEGAPDNVKVLPIKALDVDESGEAIGTTTSIISAINYAIQNDVDIINMSLGGEATEPGEQTAINRAYENGITIIVASGNSGVDLDASGNDCYPAENDNVITIGAVRTKLMTLTSTSQLTTFQFFVDEYDTYKNTTANDVTIADFSNYGSCIDFVAPGVLLVGLTKETSTGNVCSYDGTSQATPHITAAAATIKTYNSSYTSDQIEEILAYYAQDLGVQGKDNYYGNGFVSFKNFEECDCNGDGCDGIYCFGCTNTECKYHLGRANKLSSIEITQEPTKKVYLMNDEFDPTGMVVTAKYSDNTTKTVTDYTYTTSTWVLLDGSQTNYTVEITYTEGRSYKKNNTRSNCVSNQGINRYRDNNPT